VILFFDNDIGRGVPDALHSVDIRVLSVLRRYRRGNTPDTRWLRDAGQNGWLVISCNKDILNVDEERELIISERVGFVFLTSGQDKAREILKSFGPDVVIGVGGYASGPLLRMAALKGIPALIQEQNSYPGITNIMLAKRVEKICVAYDGMEKFFPAKNIIITGNPVRQDIAKTAGKETQAMEFFGLDRNKKALLVIGGSLGARRRISDDALPERGAVEGAARQPRARPAGLPH